MAQALQATVFWEKSRGELLLDVRSPAEFRKGHIPGAVNLPLFENDERARVGTLYKQVGKREAVEAGLEIVGPKIPAFIKFVKPLATNNRVFVHCWRGGMRSGSVAWLLETAGYEVFTLQGGYKSFRHLTAFELAKSRNFLVLGGPTASAKTPLLQRLQQMGEAILDLETLACHRGSAFGAIAQPEQPTQEQFENNVFEKIIGLPDGVVVWVEDESRGIGRCFLPLAFRELLRNAPLIFIERSIEVRIEEALRCYGNAAPTELISCFEKIEKRMGTETMRLAIKQVQEGQLKAAVALALRYYDKAYRHSLELRGKGRVSFLKFENENTDVIATKLLHHIKNNG